MSDPGKVWRENRLLLRNVGVQGSHTLAVYESRGGYQALRKALKTTPDWVANEVKESGLRGRGGAGFGCGMKWGFIPKGNTKPVYLCVNADESEPGTFKDRYLMEHDPHACLEGTILAAYAIRAKVAYFYIRGEYPLCARRIEGAIQEARAAGYLGKNVLGSGCELEVHVHKGAGAYICGEETSLMSSLEGRRPYPRIKPPFPAVEGLWRCPTIINNVETLANVPLIVERGAAWYKTLGKEKNTGTRLFCVSGHVQKPGLYEFEMGIPLRTIIYDFCGGIREGRKLKAVIPGGSSVPVLRADEIDVEMDFDATAKAGTLLGSCGVIVMDETVCMVEALWNLEQFYAHESCGQCTPCREGVHWLEKIIGRIEAGRGKPRDVDLVFDVANNIEGNTVCPLGDAAAWPAKSFVKKFRDEFVAHARDGRCPLKGAACVAAAR